MRLRRLLFIALLASLALVFNFVEGLLPMPLPGIKLGAANVFSLVALVLLGPKAAFAVTLLRVALAGLLFGNPFAFACSMTGALLSTAVMAVLYTRFGDDFSLTWVSVAGAWAFNLGQIAVVALLVHSAAVLYYLPVLLVVGTGTGFAVGALAGVVCARIRTIPLFRSVQNDEAFDRSRDF